jgi:hypothetical protein
MACTSLLDARSFGRGDLALLDLSLNRHPHRQKAPAPLHPASESTSLLLSSACAQEVTPVNFVDLDEDVLLEIASNLADDPLVPASAVALARATCRTLRTLPRLQQALAALRAQHEAASRLVQKTELTLRRLGAAGKLTWPKRSLVDADAVTLGALPLPSLVEIDLRFNQVGDRGLLALAAASAEGRLPNLGALGLSNNRVTDQGALALAAAATDISAPAFADLESLNLGFTRIGAEGMSALALAVGEGGMPRLQYTSYMLAGNTVDEAIFAQAMRDPSEERRGSMHENSGSIGGAHAAILRARRAGRARRPRPRPDVVPFWNVHGSGIDVATTLASSYRTGTLL